MIVSAHKPLQIDTWRQIQITEDVDNPRTSSRVSYMNATIISFPLTALLRFPLLPFLAPRSLMSPQGFRNKQGRRPRLEGASQLRSIQRVARGNLQHQPLQACHQGHGSPKRHRSFVRRKQTGYQDGRSQCSAIPPFDVILYE
jgi:hypothetical protein